MIILSIKNNVGLDLLHTNNKQIVSFIMFMFMTFYFAT